MARSRHWCYVQDMKALALLTALAFVGLTLPAMADCKCRANGRVFSHGQVVCLKLPTGTQLARCGMVLNNSSWKKIQDGCPEAALDGNAISLPVAHEDTDTHPHEPVLEEPRG
ncbi:MAG TPA: hypothetical protein VMF90_00720 [Rhizobiaceae bacterium]|nr:hypothetical protein [Rhizobiaceae bacterium]